MEKLITIPLPKTSYFWALSPTDVDINFHKRTFSPDHHGKMLTQTHPTWWTIEGKITYGYYSCVRAFTATHPEHGKVLRDERDMRNNTVRASSKSAYIEFSKKHRFFERNVDED